RVRQDLEHAYRAGAHHELERARIKKIADEHRGGVAERRVRGRQAAAQGRFVDDVVVEQGGRVDHLDDGGERVVRAARVAAGPRGEDHERGAQPLAAAADDVFGDLPDQHDV